MRWIEVRGVPDVRRIPAALCIAAALLCSPISVRADDAGNKAAVSPRVPTSTTSGKSSVIEGAVISPLQNANVGAEVSGIIETFKFNEGDPVKEGDVVAEISPRRYDLMAKRAASVCDARRIELEGLRHEKDIKQHLLELHAATRLAAMDVENREDVARAQLREAANDFQLAKLNLQDCQVRAPFSGYLAVRYKQPHEPVDRLEKIFAVLDSHKVYAVGNLPEDMLDRARVGAAATFVYAQSRRFTGRIERIASLIDPQSRTKRIYVILDNSDGQLEIGMTGSIALE